MIFTGCHAIALTPRGADDPHVMFRLFTEDDENWFDSGIHASSFWLPGLAAIMAEAEQWLIANCDRSEDAFGWRFRI